MSAVQCWSYKLTNTYKEHHSQPIYCVSFNLVDPAHHRLFATCGGRRATIYECQDNGGIEPLQGYLDESDAEELFTVKWSIDRFSGAPLLLVAGKQGVVRVFDCNKQALLWTAVGHGEAINDISVHPDRQELFLTASRDYSLRLWNLKTRTCVLVVTGDGGHTNEVLSIDFHPTDGNCFISSGMDDTIKIWWLKGNEKDIIASYGYNEGSGRSFAVGHMAAPIFSTHKVHWNYVDCVRWLGPDLVLSKSVDNRVLLWQPLLDKTRIASQQTGPRYNLKGHVHLVQEFYMEDADIWFIRFAMDTECRVLACGNRTGKVFVWDLAAPSEEASRAKAVMHVGSKDNCTVRQTTVSADGAIILACCDAATISRFDVETQGFTRGHA